MITTESYAFPGTLMEIISDDECWWYSHVECFDLKNLKCVCPKIETFGYSDRISILAFCR